MTNLEIINSALARLGRQSLPPVNHSNWREVVAACMLDTSSSGEEKVKEPKRRDEMTFEDWQRGARKVLDEDHKGMSV